MKKKKHSAALVIQAAMTAVLITLAACSTETALHRLLGTSAAVPVFYGCKIPEEGKVEFRFSSAVTVASMFFDPPMEAEVLSQGETVALRFNSPLPGGSKVSADLLVEDKDRNTLNVLVSFRTRNNRMPTMVINELRTEYSKPRVEFVELKTLSAGNLGAMRLFAAYDKEEPLYEFPPVEVKAGEYIVVHTRSMEEGLADETGSNTNLSKGTDSSSARDFWLPGSLKLHNTNAFYIMDQDNKIIDGVLLFNGKTKWKDSVAAAAVEMAKQGAWNGSDPESAFTTDGTTATRTICRTSADTNSAGDWYITVSSGATPGKANNPGRYKK